VLVYGASIFGRVVRQLILDCGLGFAGYVDDWNKGSEIVGALADLQGRLDPAEFDIVLGVGYKHMAARREIAERVRSSGFKLPALVHPRAHVSSTARISDGALVMAAAVVDTESIAGPLSVLWPGAILNHHAVLEGNTFLSPGSIVCGNTRLGTDCFVGAGAVVADGLEVPSHTFVKAGSVYCKGKPAREMESRRSSADGGGMQG